MTFHNGSVHAGIVNQVHGNQFNSGGQQVVTMSITAAREAANDLRRMLTPLPGSFSSAEAIRAQLDDINAGMRAPEPQKGRVAGALERLTRLLSKVGAFVTKGAELVRPLQFLAHWLGPLGGPILKLLPLAA